MSGAKNSLRAALWAGVVIALCCVLGPVDNLAQAQDDDPLEGLGDVGGAPTPPTSKKARSERSKKPSKPGKKKKAPTSKRARAAEAARKKKEAEPVPEVPVAAPEKDDNEDLDQALDEPKPAPDTTSDTDRDTANVTEPAAEQSSDAESADGAEPAAATDADDGPSVAITPFAGAGFTTRSYRRPVPFGAQSLDASAVPALEAGLGVTVWPARDFSLVFSLIYQTAIGFTVTERPALALENKVAARSERVALDVAPRWRFGAIRLAIPIGATLRTLWPEIHHSLTPGYSLLGPHARVDLSATIARILTVHITPEVHWITQIDELLLKTGVNSQGVALGGDVAVLLQLSSVWGVGVNYRESHALITTTRGFTFTDVERYMTLRLSGTF